MRFRIGEIQRRLNRREEQIAVTAAGHQIRLAPTPAAARCSEDSRYAMRLAALKLKIPRHSDPTAVPWGSAASGANDLARHSRPGARLLVKRRLAHSSLVGTKVRIRSRAAPSSTFAMAAATWWRRRCGGASLAPARPARACSPAASALAASRCRGSGRAPLRFPGWRFTRNARAPRPTLQRAKRNGPEPTARTRPGAAPSRAAPRHIARLRAANGPAAAHR